MRWNLIKWWIKQWLALLLFDIGTGLIILGTAAEQRDAVRTDQRIERRRLEEAFK